MPFLVLMPHSAKRCVVHRDDFCSGERLARYRLYKLKNIARQDVKIIRLPSPSNRLFSGKNQWNEFAYETQLFHYERLSPRLRFPALVRPRNTRRRCVTIQFIDLSFFITGWFLSTRITSK